GKGIKIGVVDSGINPNLPEFAGRIDPASRDVAGSRGVSDEGGHGTAVTSVAAAARDGVGTLGVAFDSTIISLRADSPGTCADTAKDAGCKFGDSAIARGIDVAVSAGARVINLSLGGSAPGSTLLASIHNAVSRGVVLVISAGNDGEKPEGANPNDFALVPAQRFPGHIIIAGSVGVAGATGGIDVSQISNFSNRAGNGAAYYLTAQGFRDRAPDHNGTHYLWNGTSFSAPVITGAVALLAQAFPNLTGSQIVDILFKSADDLGAAGTDSIFGRGRLNITRAFQPIGTTSVAGSQTPVSTTSNGDLPESAGDAARGGAGVIILDGYDRAFVLDLARTLRKAEQSRPLAQSLQGNMHSGSITAGKVSVGVTIARRPEIAGGFAVEKLGIGPDDARKARLIAGSAVARVDSKTAVAIGFAEGAKAMERRLSGAEAGAFLIARDTAGGPGFSATRDGSLALRRQVAGFGVTLSGETGEVWREVQTSASGSPYRWTSLAVDRQLGSNWLSAGMSRLEERQSLLGGRLSEALGGGGSTSLFLDLEARRKLGSGWSTGLSARRGWTDFAGGKFQTAGYGFDLAKIGVLGGSDRIGLRLSQPLRIERGGVAMMLPTAYDYGTLTATNSLTSLSLTPSGREIDAELSYGTGLFGGAGWLGGNLFLRRQPGHIAAADNDVGAAIRFTLGF
ncbi:MAG TPA: S8 family peptidase, partial [Sphingomicrobium sp.]|nr:S8 family peptidase [Sphingomicrobium sp.]